MSLKLRMCMYLYLYERYSKLANARDKENYILYTLYQKYTIIIFVFNKIVLENNMLIRKSKFKACKY